MPTISEVSEPQVAEVGSAGDFGEYGTLGSVEPLGSPGTGMSGQPAVPEHLSTLRQLKACFAVKKKDVEKSCFRLSRTADVQIRLQRVRQKNMVEVLQK